MYLSPAKPLIHLAIMIAAAVSIAGCATKGDWEDAGRVPGPVIAGNNVTSRVFHRCIQAGWPHGIYGNGVSCLSAFRLSTGRLQEMDEVTQSIDAYVRALDIFSSLTPVSRGSASYYEPPYKFYLLTLEPVVVLVVPFTGRSRGHCSGPMNLGRCVPSILVEEGYPWETRPDAGSQAFWFSPGITKGLVAVPPGNERYTLPLQGVEAYLEKSNGKWAFTRSR